MTGSGSLRLTTASASQTMRLGETLAGLLRCPCLVALRGDLGAGKTCLVAGMARAVRGPSERAPATHSPTFTLVNEYEGSPRLVHVDLYRLAGASEALDLGVEEFFASPGEPGPHAEMVCVVEWAERAEPLLPDARLDIRLEHAGGDRRLLTLHDRGVLAAGWRDALVAAGFIHDAATGEAP
jgi:tRNA threonylcarbamoyladenosine biosynthesis protein TsaE